MRKRGNYCIIRVFILGEGWNVTECEDRSMYWRSNVLMLRYYKMLHNHGQIQHVLSYELG